MRERLSRLDFVAINAAKAITMGSDPMKLSHNHGQRPNESHNHGQRPKAITMGSDPMKLRGLAHSPCPCLLACIPRDSCCLAMQLRDPCCLAMQQVPCGLMPTIWTPYINTTRCASRISWPCSRSLLSLFYILDLSMTPADPQCSLGSQTAAGLRQVDSRVVTS
jgi:hypothetical protein